MKYIMTCLSLLLFYPFAWSAEIEFAGVFNLRGEPHFSLLESERGARSGWVKIGQSFQGFHIESYDRESGVLRLTSSEKSLFLTLRASVVQAGGTSAETIFRSKVVAELRHDEVLATGGFRNLDGDYLYAFLEPEEAQTLSAREREIHLRLNLFSIPAAVIGEIGLESLATDQRTTEQHGQIWSRDDFSQVQGYLRQTRGVDILTAPSQTVPSGHEAAFRLGDLKILTIPQVTEDRSGFEINFTWEQPNYEKQ